jgi:hypothetical protein
MVYHEKIIIIHIKKSYVIFININENISIICIS